MGTLGVAFPPAALAAQISNAAKKSRRRLFAVFGLRGPSTGPGAVKERLGMKPAPGKLSRLPGAAY